MTTTASPVRLQLVGVQFAPISNDPQAAARTATDLQQAFEQGRIAPGQLAPPRLPVQPVFADESGRKFVYEFSSLGQRLAALPDGPGIDLSGGGLSAGGFISLEQLKSGMRANAGAPAGMLDLRQLQSAALAALFPLKGAPSEPSSENQPSAGSKPNPLDGLSQALAMGLGQELFSMAVKALAQGGGLQSATKMIANMSTGGLLEQLGIGAAKQLAGMATGMLMDSLWQVDDESTAAETAANKYAKDAVQRVQGELMDHALAEAGFGKAPGDIGDRIKKFFGGNVNPQHAAIRMGDVDAMGNPVLPSCSPDVLIEGQPAARGGDPVKPPGVKLELGSATVNVNNLVATRLLDTISPVAKFTKAATRTFIGGDTSVPPPPAPPPKPSDATAAAACSGSAAGPSEVEKLISGASGASDQDRYFMAIEANDDGTHAHIAVYKEDASQQMTKLETTYGKWPNMPNPGASWWNPFDPDGFMPFEQAARYFDALPGITFGSEDILQDYWEDNSLDGHWSDSFAVQITSQQYAALQQYVQDNQSDWTLNHQCVDFAVDAFNYITQTSYFGPDTSSWLNWLTNMPSDLKTQIKQLNK